MPLPIWNEDVFPYWALILVRIHIFLVASLRYQLSYQIGFPCLEDRKVAQKKSWRLFHVLFFFFLIFTTSYQLSMSSKSSFPLVFTFSLFLKRPEKTEKPKCRGDRSLKWNIPISGPHMGLCIRSAFTDLVPKAARVSL